MSSPIDVRDTDYFDLDPKEEAVAAFVSEVGRQLQRAYSLRRDGYDLTQSELARRLGVERSRVSRCLSGAQNLTLSTVAEFAWALDAQVNFSIKFEAPAAAKWIWTPVPEHEGARTPGQPHSMLANKVAMRPRRGKLTVRESAVAKVRLAA